MHRLWLTSFSRLRTLIDMNDVEGRRYSLHHIPKGLRWGLNWDKDDNLLCLDGKPLMIVLLAEVDQAYWVNNDKSLKKSVALYLRPICDTDAETGKNLLASFATFKGAYRDVVADITNPAFSRNCCQREEARRSPDCQPQADQARVVQ